MINYYSLNILAKNLQDQLPGAVLYKGPLWSGTGFDEPGDLKWQTCSYGKEKSAVQWASTYDTEALYIIVSDPAHSGKSISEPAITGITVKIEPRRLWLCTRFVFDPGNENREDQRVRIVKESGKLHIVMRIPFKNFLWSEEELHPIRIDVQVQKKDGGTNSWCPDNPTGDRLALGSDNPADLGWLLFSGK